MTRKSNYWLTVLGLTIFINSLNASLPDQSVFDFVLNKVRSETWKKCFCINLVKTDKIFICFRITTNLFFQLRF